MMLVKVRRYDRYVIDLVKEVKVDLDAVDVEDLDIFFDMEPAFIKVNGVDIELDKPDSNYEHLGYADFIVDDDSTYKVNQELLEANITNFDYNWDDYPLLSLEAIRRDKKINDIIFKK